MEIDEEQHVKRLSLTDSTVNRSQAMTEAGWFRMNWHHVSRFGPGLRFGAMIRRILEAEISVPSFFSSPWMRR